MILDSHFNRIVILSLPGCEDRAERALNELREKRLSVNAVVVKAVNGRICTPSDWWGAGPGSWGCMQSHYRVVQEAVMDEIESLLVIEDDCIWEHDAERLVQEFLEQVPDDWGQIYFGGQHRLQHGRPEKIQGKPAVLKGRSIHRTHAYAIHQRAMVRFLQHIIYAPDYIADKTRHQFSAHVDHQLERAHRDGHWQVYAPSWWLAGQGVNHSTINGRHQPEQWWQVVEHDGHRWAPLIVCDTAPTPEQMIAIHFGKNLLEDDHTWDVGVQRSPTENDLVDVMETVSREAVRDRRLPGLAVDPARPEKVEWISRRWLGPVVRLTSAVDIEMLRDFVANKTFRHLWWNPDPERIIRSADDAELRGRSFESRPRMVHQIWIGEKEFPPRLAAYSETIRKVFPNWDHKIWREQDLAKLAANAVIPDPILDETFPLGMRSDIIRLEVLRQHGGVYFDTDFEAIRDDVRRLYEEHQAFVYGDELSGRPANGMMAAPVGHPFLDFYLRRISATLRTPADIFDTVKLTGPEKLAEALNMWVGDWSSGEPFTIEGDTLGSFHAGGTILSLWREVAYPYHYSEGSWATFDPIAFPKARLAHHWEGGWHREAI